MSRKLTCPGCNSHTSSVQAAVDNDQPCPYCGLPATTIVAVLGARQHTTDSELLARFEQAEVRAGRAEAEVLRLRGRLAAVTALVDEWNREDQP